MSSTPQNPPDLASRPAVVVGGNSGIGLEVVRRAAGTGASVTVVDLPERPSAGLAALGGRVRYLRGDVLDPGGLEKCFTTAAEDGPVGSVFVSAGVTLPGSLLDVSAEAAQRCLLINLMGSVNTLKAAVGSLASDASVVLCASVAAYTGGGYVGGSVYGASKAGVIGLARGAARELAGRGVRVNCVAPGATTTGMVGDDPAVIERLSAKTLLDRLATPADIAASVLFLWSSAASYLTGATIDVNGGSHLG
ncbi:SDR family oxidoreductase [Streptomyces sp. NPDC047002]|uniref:SDR family NAD(P)-dependent oxidoreductase n=1 Tax=Streptomyces sp. NPDC047002 TaxID=3155475 RepID=UPI003453B293